MALKDDDKQRRTRLYQLGGILAVAIIAVVVIVAATSGGGSSSGIATGKQANQTVSQVTSLLNGVPQSGNVLGNPNAKVRIEYFGDLQCPICQTFTLTALPQLINSEVRTGQVKMAYRALQTATADQGTFVTQQVAALAAGRQNKLWDYVELFYHEQGQEGSGYVTPSYLQSLAGQVPALNLAEWSSSRADAALTQQVNADSAAATTDSFNSTPSLLVSGPRGAQKLVGAVDAGTIAQAVKAVA
jgi:protein-disulfide isomerase